MTEMQKSLSITFMEEGDPAAAGDDDDDDESVKLKLLLLYSIHATCGRIQMT